MLAEVAGIKAALARQAQPAAEVLRNDEEPLEPPPEVPTDEQLRRRAHFNINVNLNGRVRDRRPPTRLYDNVA